MHDVALIRELILKNPGIVLDDPEVLQGLLAVEAPQGGRTIDLRTVLVNRLEERLGDLEQANRDVIAAAYENLAGTNQIQRAVMSLLDPTDFAAFLRVLEERFPEILAVDQVRFCMEGTGLDLSAFKAVVMLDEGGVAAYLDAPEYDSPRPVTLRQTTMQAGQVYGGESIYMRSEAVLRLDLGEGRPAAMLVLGSSDQFRFDADQGTDLLSFLGGAFERAVRRWLV